MYCLLKGDKYECENMADHFSTFKVIKNGILLHQVEVVLTLSPDQLSVCKGTQVKRSIGEKVQRSKYSLRVKVNGQPSHYSRKCTGVNREALQLHTVYI